MNRVIVKLSVRTHLTQVFSQLLLGTQFMIPKTKAVDWSYGNYNSKLS